jgi:hypothetical protein
MGVNKWQHNKDSHGHIGRRSEVKGDNKTVSIVSHSRSRQVTTQLRLTWPCWWTARSQLVTTKQRSLTATQGVNQWQHNRDSHDHADRRSEVHWWQQNRYHWQSHRESTIRVKTTMLADGQKSTGGRRRRGLKLHAEQCMAAWKVGGGGGWECELLHRISDVNQDYAGKVWQSTDLQERCLHFRIWNLIRLMIT